MHQGSSDKGRMKCRQSMSRMTIRRLQQSSCTWSVEGVVFPQVQSLFQLKFSHCQLSKGLRLQSNQKQLEEKASQSSAIGVTIAWSWGSSRVEWPVDEGRSQGPATGDLDSETRHDCELSLVCLTVTAEPLGLSSRPLFLSFFLRVQVDRTLGTVYGHFYFFTVTFLSFWCQ